MSMLRQLPDEILALAFRHLDEKKDKQTILALRAVNKQYNRVTTPLVWCTVIDNINRQRHDNVPRVGPLQRAAWDLVQRPELASFVKAINFETWDFLGKDRYSPLPQGMQPPTSADYAAALASADLPDQVNKAILRQLCDEIPAGQLSLLLALCTKLQALLIPSDCGSFSRLITRILLRESEDGLQVTLPPRSASLTERSLQCLREVNNVNSLQNESAAQELLPLLCLPSLQVLHIHSLRDPETRTGHTVPDPPSSYLNHNPISLKFDFCMLSVAGLSRILGACENLISLTVRWHPSSYNDHLSNESVGDAIREHGQRLEFLHLDTTEVYQARSRYRIQLPSPLFGSFVSMTKLKTMAVPRCAFPLENCSVADIVSILPSNLQVLCVLGVGNEESEEERAESDAFVETCCEAKYHLHGLSKIYTVEWYHSSCHGCRSHIHFRGVDYRAKAARGLSLERIDWDKL